MSVVREEFVIVGIDVGEHESDDFYDKYEAYMDNKEEGEFTIVVDCYGGDYTLFGEVVKHGDEYSGLPLTELNLDCFNESIIRVREKAKELFGNEQQPKMYAFTHWS
ncbi:hypothetical protein GCM10023310_69460 [Paenibacillus vulneris]|uniref:Uncharacterized protein n=1 Tax=Paenibacillus vulneris TaxID=1133364 RepID=A0ABW3UGB4_9BACL